MLSNVRVQVQLVPDKQSYAAFPITAIKKKASDGTK
jgi:hypothetical protein